MGHAASVSEKYNHTFLEKIAMDMLSNSPTTSTSISHRNILDSIDYETQTPEETHKYLSQQLDLLSRANKANDTSAKKQIITSLIEFMMYTEMTIVNVNMLTCALRGLINDESSDIRILTLKAVEVMKNRSLLCITSEEDLHELIVTMLENGKYSNDIHLRLSAHNCLEMLHKPLITSSPTPSSSTKSSQNNFVEL